MKMEIKLSKFKKFQQEISRDDYEVRIGFLGNEKNNRQEGEKTNAEIAALHHFGSPTNKIPARSPFLGFTMKDKTKPIFDVMQNTLKKAVAKGNITTQDRVDALALGGIAGENLIEETITTKGFGKYAPLSKKTIKIKKQNKDKILIETGDLVDARVSQVVKKNI
jgi:hypothetical protein